MHALNAGCFMENKKKIRFICILITAALLFFSSCGEKGGPVINFQLQGADALADPSVSFVVFKVISKETDGFVIDTNNDGNPDVFGFPENCRDASSSTGFKVSCGFSPSGAPFDLGGIPLNFNYSILVYFIDSSDTIIYYGESAVFMNSASSQTIPIVVQAGSPP